jgi:hypothetical protein
MLQKDPDLTWRDVRRKLRESADPLDGAAAGYHEDTGWGKVNAGKALDLVRAKVPEAPQIVITPVVEPWERYRPLPDLVRELQQRVSSQPAGQLLTSLASQHYDEIARLVQNVRRVGAAWQLIEGPRLLRDVLTCPDPEAPLLPETLRRGPLHAGLERLLRELFDAGSAALRQDIVKHRHLVLALPGSRTPNG